MFRSLQLARIGLYIAADSQEKSVYAYRVEKFRECRLNDVRRAECKNKFFLKL